MADVEAGNQKGTGSKLNADEGLKAEEKEEEKNQPQNKDSKFPRWMQNYRIASYIIYGFIAFYAFIYLIYVGVHQANPRMEIQYAAVVRYLEYNSYSILSPLLCPLLMALLAYHVKHKVKLEEGDFFGILGILLLLSLFNIHDAWGILKLLHWNRDHDINHGVMKAPTRDDTSRNNLHWQYAWSTRSICARRFVKALQYQYQFSKKHVTRQIVFDRSTRPGGRAAMTEVSESPCNNYHDSKSRAHIRGWMEDIQNEFQCCGPYGYKEWKEWFDSPEETGCDTRWIEAHSDEIRSCFDPLMRWLDNIMVATFWIQLLQGIFYIISMFLAGLHHSAMKLEEKELEKKYSLLSMTEKKLDDDEPHWYSMSRPKDQAVIVGEYPPKEEGEEEDDGHGSYGHGSYGKGGKIHRTDSKSSTSKKKKKKDKSSKEGSLTKLKK